MAREVTQRQDYSLRATKKTEDEIGALVDRFNQMLAQIQATDRELRASEQRLRQLAAIVESSEEAIIGGSLDGVVVSWNRAAERMYGYAAEDIIGRSISQIVPPDRSSEIDRILLKLRAGEGVTHYETVWLAKDGRRIDVALTVSPMRNEADQIMGASVIARDITERKRLEKQILEISDREQGRMGQDLHDGLCQHLVSTAFASNLLRQKLAGKSSPEEKDAGEIARLLDDAITQARSLARGLYPVKLEAEGLVSALEELAGNVTERFGIACTVNCSQAVFISDNAVATHLYRIVQEAVTNAVKHSKAEHIIIGLTAAEHALTIKVGDDGIGIREPFQGTAGMGLHIMLYRARMIGGRLKIGRGENGGTIILCSLEQKSIE